MSSTAFNEILTRRSRQLVPTDTKDSLISVDKKYDNDHLFEQLSDLVNVQFRAWYCRQFYRLGRDQVLRLASVARADAKRDSRKYFSVLLKNCKSPGAAGGGTNPT